MEIFKTENIEKSEKLENKPVNHKLKKVSQEFEALFVNMLLKQMRESIPNDGILPDNFSTKTYKEMYDRELSKIISEGEKLGIAKFLYDGYYDQAEKNISKMQEQISRLKQKEIPVNIQSKTYNLEQR